MIRRRRSWRDLSENLPVDILPASNGEHVPRAATEQELWAMAKAEAETERWRRRFGMSRRDFVRSAAATAIGFWAIDAVGDGKWGSYAKAHNTEDTDACDLEWFDPAQVSTHNLPGEFVFDVQSHHIDPEGMWRVNNPAFAAFFAAVWPQAGPLGNRPGVRSDGTLRGFGAGEVDPLNNLSRFHYLKELFLDSATTMTVLSAVPSAPDERNPLPIAEAALTVHTVNQLAGSQRSVMHAFVMPNRGSAGSNTDGYGLKPVHLDEELELMELRVQQYPDILRGWKTYCAWGDVPYASGWFLDSPEIGIPFLQQIEHLSGKYGIPPVLATHKGFALPGFDQRAAAPRDVGPAAAQFPGIKFLIYHSGHDIPETSQSAYDPDSVPDDPTATHPRTRTVDAFIKSLIGSGVAATDPNGNPQGHLGKTSPYGNSPNVYAELGSVWRDFMGNANNAAHLLGKLITYVGPERVVWGTDSLWYGSPQREIVALRNFEFSPQAKVFYNLPHGMEGDYENPQVAASDPSRTIRNRILGRNAAEAYGVDPDIKRNGIACDEVNGLRQSYITDPLTERERSPLASNQMPAARTPSELWAERKDQPWAP